MPSSTGYPFDILLGITFSYSDSIVFCSRFHWCRILIDILYFVLNFISSLISTESTNTYRMHLSCWGDIIRCKTSTNCRLVTTALNKHMTVHSLVFVVNISHLLLNVWRFRHHLRSYHPEIGYKFHSKFIARAGINLQTYFPNFVLICKTVCIVFVLTDIGTCRHYH